ncbi:hypothetical protein COO60DRAFT_1527353 [Scenedesmus sp. NREL 46B-D3]|nr:hypothetical protein COO60DRAFT_1527353 [Scenedesmus sp. NREL 46B-D3]
MSANPALVQTFNNELIPAPFANEVFVLKRPKVGFELNGVQTRNGKWATTGALYLSNVRLVFVAEKPDASGLAGFDMPLVYISKDKLNQPIFGCNNLAGQVWPAVTDGGPSGTLPPHSFKVLFKEVSLSRHCVPAVLPLAERARKADAAQRRASLAQTAPAVEELVHKAFVDPSDPSTIYLSQPAAESQRLQYQPTYAPNYGRDEKYQPMAPHH